MASGPSSAAVVRKATTSTRSKVKDGAGSPFGVQSGRTIPAQVQAAAKATSPTELTTSVMTNSCGLGQKPMNSHTSSKFCV